MFVQAANSKSPEAAKIRSSRSRTLEDLRDLLEALDEGVSVNGFDGGDLQDEHVKRALKEVGSFMPRHSR